MDDDKDLEEALKHLVFDLLTTSTFKVDVQGKILEAVQLQCTRSAAAFAGGGSAGLDSSPAADHGPYPVLKNWSFEALPSGLRVVNPKKNLRFRARGTLVFHPQKSKDVVGSDWYTSGICGIASEGVVTTASDTPYRLQGDPCMQKGTTYFLKDAMNSFREGSWLQGGEAAIYMTMKQISSYFNPDDGASSHKSPEPENALQEKRASKRDRNSADEAVNLKPAATTRRK